MFDFKFPDVGEGIIEGTIVKWRVKEGDQVKNDQVLVEIETDKAIVEIPSPRADRILKLYGKEGEMIKVGAVLVTFGQPGESTAASSAPAATPQKEPQRGVGVIGTLEVSDAVMKSPTQQSVQVTTSQGVNILPRTRILAQQLNVDLATIKGTGPNGRIIDEDIKKAAAGLLNSAATVNAAAPHAAGSEAPISALKLYGPAERLPYKGIRKVIAQAVAQSAYTAPHVSMMDNADVTKLAQVRETAKVEAAKNGIKLTFLPYIIEALVKALKEFPVVNSSIDERAQEIVIKKYYNIAFAVDTEDGLLVPVIKNADQKSLTDIARELSELAEKARTRKIKPADMEGSTCSITNYGSFGSLYATPIINYPDAAILGIGRIQDMPVVTEKGTIEPRKILGLTFTFDHRIFDGALAAKFLRSVIKNLESY